MNLYDCKILLVDDEKALREMVCGFLEHAGFRHVSAAENCREAEKRFFAESPHLILLDVMLPDGDGFTLLQDLHRQSDVPVLFLSARDEDEDRLRGLGMGADDYITKPFSMPVLLRKIAAVLRRSSRQKDMPQIMCYKDLTLDLEGYKVYTKEESIDLTPREFEILRELLIHKGRILTRQNLLLTLWKYEFFGEERIVDTHIKNLRKKLGAADYIETIRGVGYRIDKED